MEATIDRVSVFYEFKKNKIHEIDWILKMLTEFYFKIQYFNFDWEITITITLLHSFRNTQQWQVRLKSVLSSQNQQQPIVPIQLLFQHSSQPECSPV